MGKIQLLDENTINKIAAGEVVERPSSIVKELIENAIDAGASAITVDIQEGGLTMIRVTDNGSGISREDIQKAFLRHSTSKINQIEDLDRVSSLGFRGEALASIAAVSQVELITKTYEELTGIRYVIEGGAEKGLQEIGCPEGTTLIVNHLFYNVPARRKFLKTPMTEGGYIAELMNKLALSAPGISFKFINNRQTKLHTAGNNHLEDVIFSVFGKEIQRNLIPLEYETEGLKLTGFIGKPVIARANRNHENYFINGRYIRSKVIQKAVEDAYKPKLILHRYPFTALYLTIASEAIDVNVHPNKMDVRFNNEPLVYEAVFRAVTAALNRQELIPEVSFFKEEKVKQEPIKNIPEPFEKRRLSGYEIKSFVPQDEDASKGSREAMLHEGPRPFYEKTQEQSRSISNNIGHMDGTNAFEEHTTDVKKNISTSEEQTTAVKADRKDAFNPEKQPLITGSQLSLLEEAFLSKESQTKHRIIGQLFNTYWIVEFSDKYFLIDQHAAHEKVLYERIMKSIASGSIHTQRLLRPKRVRLSLRWAGQI